jgi:DNA-binding MarR family transcriptional regulator
MNNEKGKELFEVIKRFRKISRSDNYLKDLNANEIMVCGILMQAKMNQNIDKIQAKDLSEKLKISRPALNTLLNKLEDKELIERIRTKENRKSVFIGLTEKAYDKYHNEQMKFVTFMNNIVTKMGEEDTDKLINLLNKLYTIMEDEVK